MRGSCQGWERRFCAPSTRVCRASLDIPTRSRWCMARCGGRRSGASHTASSTSSGTNGSTCSRCTTDAVGRACSSRSGRVESRDRVGHDGPRYFAMGHEMQRSGGRFWRNGPPLSCFRNVPVRVCWLPSLDSRRDEQSTERGRAGGTSLSTSRQSSHARALGAALDAFRRRAHCRLLGIGLARPGSTLETKARQPQTTRGPMKTLAESGTPRRIDRSLGWTSWDAIRFRSA